MEETARVPARTTPVEIAWFAAFCDDDYEYLGVPVPALRSSFEHCREIVLRAERGGFSEEARAVAARGADVYLMWPDTLPAVAGTIRDLRARAAAAGRRLRFGYRVHVIVRESESRAREAARRLLSRLDAGTGDAIRRRSLDHASAGVRRQAEVRDAADAEGFVEEQLWTGIGRARSGCGAALVGDPDQVLAKLRAYVDLGVEALILSGYPHARECDLFARYVLPRLDHAPLAF